MPIIGVQVGEEEALRRAKAHVEQYHLELARLNVDFLTDYRTEVDIAGIQLLHLPFWHASYIYRPRTILRHFYKPKEKHVVLEGHNVGVLSGELAMQHRDKVWINALVCVVATLLMLVLGAVWHPAFLLVALFTGAIAIGSAYIASLRASNEQQQAKLVDGSGTPSRTAAQVA